MIPRMISPISRRSYFLFGARGTGKTTWLEEQYPPGDKNLWIDLLNDDQEKQYRKRPQLLDSILTQAAKDKSLPSVIIIDEVQKVPKLLDIAQSWIRKRKLLFILTGSSARKLKRGAGNLLGGRANVYSMFPLTSLEIGSQFNLQKALEWGTLPEPWFLSSDRERSGFLRAYASTYLKEEILQEQLIRKIDPFRDFLEVAAQCVGQPLNFEKIGRDVGVDHKTIQAYFGILEETLVGIMLRPFHRSLRKSALQQPKFYYFDTGVQRQLSGALGIPLLPQSSLYGQVFEAWLIQEIIRLSIYREKDFRFSFFRSKHGTEVDLILSKGQRHVAIEIKAATSVDWVEVRTLARLVADFPGKCEAFYVSQDPQAQEVAQVSCLHWSDFLRRFFGAPGSLQSG